MAGELLLQSMDWCSIFFIDIDMAKQDELIYTFIFIGIWRDTWYSRAMICQFGQLCPRLRFQVGKRVHWSIHSF